MSDVQTYDESIDVTESTGLSNERAVKKRRTKAQIASEERIDSIRGVMSVKPGRQLLYWLLADLCHFWKPSTCVNSRTGGFDPLGTMFNEGSRAVGIELEKLMREASIENYSKMLTEAKPLPGGSQVESEQ